MMVVAINQNMRISNPKHPEPKNVCRMTGGRESSTQHIKGHPRRPKCGNLIERAILSSARTVRLASQPAPYPTLLWGGCSLPEPSAHS